MQYVAESVCRSLCAHHGMSPCRDVSLRVMHTGASGTTSGHEARPHFVAVAACASGCFLALGATNPVFRNRPRGHTAWRYRGHSTPPDVAQGASKAPYDHRWTLMLSLTAPDLQQGFPLPHVSTVARGSAREGVCKPLLCTCSSQQAHPHPYDVWACRGSLSPLAWGPSCLASCLTPLPSFSTPSLRR